MAFQKNRFGFGSLAGAAFCALALFWGCAEKSPRDDPFNLQFDRQMEQYIAAVGEALEDLEVEEADAAYAKAGKRLLFLADNPYAAQAVMDYRERLIGLAGKIVESKKNARGTARVVIHRGYDPRVMESPERTFVLGDIRGRVARLPSHRRADVEAEIDRYTNDQGRRQYNRFLRRLAEYRNHIESVFAAHGLPRELACVAMIESAVDPSRVSHAGAAGLWQFIPETARRYRLLVTGDVDQRFDPVLSTYAAAAYLRDLLRMFDGDFASALAGYNCGEGYVAQCLVSDSGIGSFWDLGHHGREETLGMTIPRETYDYVARFFAVAAIYQNLAFFGFEQPLAKDQPFVLLEVTGEVDIEQLARDLEMDPGGVAAMNPSLFSHRTAEGFPTVIRLPAGPEEDYVVALRRTQRYRLSYIYRHKVTNYQSLRAIAQDYGVSEARIASMNNLAAGPRLTEGNLLLVPASTRNDKAALASEENLSWWHQRRLRTIRTRPR